MRSTNIGWGAPRIHGERLKLGIEISQATVSKSMARHPKPPSQTWRTFLENHVADLASMDFFTVPNATFRVLYVFIILRGDRREIGHFNVTEHPTARWTAQQIVEPFPFDSPPRYLLRDRDRNCGDAVAALFQVGVFRNRGFAVAAALGFCFQLAVGGLLFVLPVFLSSALYLDALETGLVLLPCTLGIFLSALTASRLPQAISPVSVVRTSLVVMLLDGLWVYQTAGLKLEMGSLAPALFAFGAGAGMVLARLTEIALFGIASTQLGEATGGDSTGKELGVAFGVSVLGSIFHGVDVRPGRRWLFHRAWGNGDPGSLARPGDRRTRGLGSAHHRRPMAGLSRSPTRRGRRRLRVDYLQRLPGRLPDHPSDHHWYHRLNDHPVIRFPADGNPERLVGSLVSSVILRAPLPIVPPSMSADKPRGAK
jgi:hypothetical protein